jgi:hypothetical protein
VSIADDTIALVDQRIRLHDKQERATGTVVSRATIGPAAAVLFDGSTTPMPVKVLGHVFCQPGDRVALDRYGSDWLITGSFSGPGFGEATAYQSGLPSPTGALTSSTYVDLVEFGTMTFTKYHDNTFIRVALDAGAYSSVAVQTLEIGARLTAQTGGAGYTPTDYVIIHRFFSSATIHQPMHGAVRVTGVPAGTYTVTLRWKKISGSGNFVADQNDSFALEMDERVRSSAPNL